MRPLILKSQDALLAEIEEEVGSSAAGGLWTAANIYRAINRAAQSWAGKVVLPRIYEFPTGFDGSAWRYAVPDYIRGDIDVEIRVAFNTGLSGLVSDGGSDVMTWTTVFAGRLEPEDAGGENAVFAFHTMPYAQDGRILWWVENGPIPTTATDLPALSGGITSTATTLTVDQAITIADNGWVKVDGEYIGYAGVTRGVSTTTLNNLERGLFQSTAVVHDAADIVYWCIGVDDNKLWNQLTAQALCYLHEMRLHRGGMQDRRQHQEMVNYLQERANRFWTIDGYVTQRKPRLEMSQQALGRLPWT